MNNRVLVTGFDMITSLGLDWESSWDNIKKGKSGVKEISLFSPDSNQTKIAAQLPDEFEEYARKYCRKRMVDKSTRVTRMAYTCAIKALENSKIDLSQYDPARIGIVLGIVDSAFNSLEKEKAANDIILKSMNNASCALLSIKYKIEGPCFPISTACSSSAYAIGCGMNLIKSGICDVVIVGGADSIISPEQVAGFNELNALSENNEQPQNASRPFTKNRDGFVIGEGAGMLILECENSALKRKADIYGEVAGYSLTTEGYNLLSPKRDGLGMAKTMTLALKNAKIDINDVDYINAHGTSTTLNDKYETMAIKQVFGEKAGAIPVSSTKSMIGHTIGAAGSIESIVTLLSINDNIIPPTINHGSDEKDDELDLDYVPNESRNQQMDVGISNSFAFGGHNATIVLKKYNVL